MPWTPAFTGVTREFSPFRNRNYLVAMRKSRKPTWSEVKSSVVNLNQKQLLTLVADLYRFSKENQAFFHARFGVGDDPLAPYKNTIDECMYPNVYSNCFTLKL